jgi:hypothetical protein
VDRAYTRAAPVTVAAVPWIIVAVGAVSLLVLAPALLHPALGPTDDHEIPFLRSQITVDGLGAVLFRYIDEGTRFRPLYWVGRIGETLVWSQNAAGWYLDRLVLLFASLLLSVWAFRAFVPLGWAVVGTAAAFAGPQLEPWYRLGPQEAYAVPLTLAALGLIGRSRFGWGIALAVLTALTKEVFVASSLALIAFAWWRGARRSALLGGIAVGLVALAVLVTGLTSSDPFVQSRASSFLSEPRYLWPWLIGAGLGVAILLSRVPLRWAVPLLIAIGILSLVRVRAAAHEDAGFVDRSVAFQASLAPLYGQTAVELDVSTVADYELAFAVRRFAPAAAMWIVAPTDGTSPLEVGLREQLRTIEREGGYGFVPRRTGGYVMRLP